jgi:DNA-binding SARP family transcriptional activator
MTRWAVRVVGPVRVVGRSGGAIALERKTAALLAMLALEQNVSRSRAASLLWPSSASATARANLRQLLKRLRAAAGSELVEPDDPLRFAAAVELDLESDGELLAGYEYDDCPELSDWLLVQRERCRSLRASTLLAAVERFESQGELRGALEVARRLVALRPESEESHRRVMRLCHLLGDRTAALAAFALCEEVARRFCDAGVSAETRALAYEIQSRSSHASKGG